MDAAFGATYTTVKTATTSGPSRLRSRMAAAATPAAAATKKALPEYIQQLVRKSMSNRRALHDASGADVVESTAPPPQTIQAELPPHVIPFQARSLVLNLCPPHGHALPPPPPPRTTTTAAASRRNSFAQGRQWTTKFRK